MNAEDPLDPVGRTTQKSTGFPASAISTGWKFADKVSEFFLGFVLVFIKF